MFKTLIGTVLVVSIIASRVHAAPEGYVRGQENKPLEVQQEAPLPKPAEAQQEAPLPKPAEAQQEAPLPKPAEVQQEAPLPKPAEVQQEAPLPKPADAQLKDVSDKNELAMNSNDKIEKDELHMKSKYANLESEIAKITNTEVSADLI